MLWSSRRPAPFPVALAPGLLLLMLMPPVPSRPGMLLTAARPPPPLPAGSTGGGLSAGRWPTRPVAPQSVSRWLAQLDAKVSCVVPGETESEVEVQDWLARLGLLDFWQPLRALGVTSFDDVEFVETEDLLGMGMKPVQRRKFVAAVDNLLRPSTPVTPGHGDGATSPAPAPSTSFPSRSLSVGSFPYAIPPHLHPKWGETKDLVVDKMMSTPLGKLRSFFETEAGTLKGADSSSSSSKRSGSSSSGASAQPPPWQQQGQSFHGAGESEIAEEASSLLASMEEMGKALDALGVDAWSMSIEELMALQDLALDESGLRGPDLNTPTQRAVNAFRAGDVIESQRLFALAGIEKKNTASTSARRGEDDGDGEPGLNNSGDAMAREQTGDERSGGSRATVSGELHIHNNNKDKRSKETVDAHFVSGMGALQAGDLAAATASFSSVLQLEPNHVHAAHNLGVALAQSSSLAYIDHHAIAQGTSLGGVMNAALERAIKLLGPAASSPAAQPWSTVNKSRWLFLELGVFEGHSLRRMARTMERYNRVVHGFDSWQGLPEPFAGITPAGAFSTHGKHPSDLPPNVELHSGWLNASMPAFVKQQQHHQHQHQHQNNQEQRHKIRSMLSLEDGARGNAEALAKVAFAHVDLDLYSSTVDGLGPLARAGMLVPGTVILFDEYFGWPGWDAAGAGEAAAWRDICAEHGIAWRHVLAYKQRMVVEVVE